MNISKIKTGIVETNTYFIDNENGECIIIDKVRIGFNDTRFDF